MKTVKLLMLLMLTISSYAFSIPPKIHHHHLIKKIPDELKDFNGLPTKFFNLSGQIVNKQLIFMVDTVSITSLSSNITVGYTGSGFNQILSCTITPMYPGASSTSTANVNIISVTNTTLSFKASVVNQLSIPILTSSITALQFATTVPTGLKASIKIVGW